jgi:hypothetical protein
MVRSSPWGGRPLSFKKKAGRKPAFSADPIFSDYLYTISQRNARKIFQGL